MNKFKVGYIISTLLDFGLTFIGSAGIIIYNYVCPSNSSEYKLSMTGIILVIALILTAKTIFEHTYQNKQNNLLQQLGSATDPLVKLAINKKINQHKMANSIYQRLVVLLPFAILAFVTELGAKTLEEMHGTICIVLMFMGAGSVFNVVKKPLKEQADKIKFENKARK